MFLRKIVCVDASAYSFGRWWHLPTILRLRGSSRTIWRGKKVSEQEFWQPHHNHLTSINVDIERPDDGNVDPVRRMYAETRAKISCCLVTPHRCWVSFWLSFPYDVFSIWRLKDHIADFLFFLSSAPSFWFLVNMSYNHGCHLANQFQMSAQEYESVLAAANLAAYQVGLYNESKWVGNLPWWASFSAQWVQYWIG